MVARLLNVCGLSLGRESDLLNPAPDNPEGYWENVRFERIDEALLAGFGGAWDVPPALPANWVQYPRVLPLCAQASELIREFSNYARWGWKDPRASLILEFWQELLPDLRVIICVRNPLEVARSLYRRGYSSNLFAFRLWQTYNERLLNTTRPAQRLITHQDAYFSQPEAELRRILDWLGWSISEETLTEACTVIRASLRHSHVPRRELSKAGAGDDLLALYDRLCAEAGPVFQQTLNEKTVLPPANPPPTAIPALPLSAYTPEWGAHKEEEIDALECERDRLEEALEEQGRWARELEAIAHEQQATIRAYQRALAPVLPFVRAALALKARFTGQA